MQLVPTCTVRGCDRHDVDLITATYHPDGVDEHGLATNPGSEFGEWANTTSAATTAVHTHDITPTVGLEISGMTAAQLDTRDTAEDARRALDQRGVVVYCEAAGRPTRGARCRTGCWPDRRNPGSPCATSGAKATS